MEESQPTECIEPPGDVSNEAARETADGCEETTIDESSAVQNDEIAMELNTDGDNRGEMDDEVIVVFDGENTAASGAGDPQAMSEADLISIKNVMEEKKHLQKGEPRQESLEDETQESLSQSSLPSTPVSFAEKPTNSVSRRFRGGRKKRFSTADCAAAKRFYFLRGIERRCGTRSLRRLLASNGNDSNGDDHCYVASQTRDSSAVASQDDVVGISGPSRPSQSGFCQLLFVSHYDDSLLQPATVDPAAAISEIVVDDCATPSNEIPIGDVTLTEDKELDEGLSAFFDTHLADFNRLHSEAKQLVASIGRILERNEESDEDEWKDRLLALAEPTLSKTRLIGRLSKLLDEVYYTTLVASRNPDELMIRKRSLNRAASLLRHCFADGIASNGLALISWAHWLLLEHLPAEFCAGYLLVLGELFNKVPELVTSIINFDQNTNRRVVELLSSFLAERKKTNLSSELFFHQRPPPRLPKDPILVLVSSTIRAHSDVLTRGNSRCRRFYKHLFPHLGVCMEVKFTPFKKGMTVAACSDQLCAFLTDKIREVQYYHSNRPIVVVGWQTSGLVALKAALEKSVAAVVCLGFPNLTLNGPRGGKGDGILDVPCSTLFVVGQFASTCSTTDLEEMRKRMKSERTGLVVVGGAGNDLNMSDMKLRSENLCQEVVDRSILEAVGEFLKATLETYVDTPDVAFNGNLNSNTVRRESHAKLPVSKRRRASAFGQLRDVKNEVGNARSLGKSSKSRLKPAARGNTISVGDVSFERASLVGVDRIAKSVGDETGVPFDGASTSGIMTTRKRQIRKPNVLDL